MRREPLAITNLMVAALCGVLVAVWLFVPRNPFAGVGSYLPFHMFAETFAIIVSMMIFGVMWNAYSAQRSGGLLVLSCAMLAAGLLDFGHMLSVSGMPHFVTPSSPDKGIAFWLSARFVVAAGLLVAAFRPEYALGLPRYRYLLLAVAVAIVAAVYWAILLHLDALPRFFVEGSGLTSTKIAAEFFVAAMVLVATIVFYRRARRSQSPMHVGLYAAAAVSLLSELYFAIYMARHDLFQVLGHVYKIVAYLFIYRAVFLESVRQPFEELHREVVERKNAEAEVRRVNQELEQRVLERTAALEAANKELEAFAYSVSHELRNPLGAMLPAVQVLKLQPDTTEDMRRPLEIIGRNIEREARLIDDLLSFSRSAQQPLRKQWVDQHALVRAVIESLRAEQEGRHVDVAVAELPATEADEQLLKQVWQNLLSNALKYTRGRTPARIRIGSEERDGVTAYFVQDNGVGFDMRHAHKLFGVFQRLHRADEYDGTGVGLAIVQRIVQRHGGRLWAQAEVDNGATFFFTLAQSRGEERYAADAGASAS